MTEREDRGALPEDVSADELRRLAARAHEVKGPFQGDGPGRHRRWLQAPQYVDVFADSDEAGTLQRVELTYLGHWLLVERGRVKTGATDEMLPGGPLPATRLVAQHGEVDLAIVRGARLVLSALPDRALAAAIEALLDAAGSG